MNNKEKSETILTSMDTWYNSIIEGLLEVAMEGSRAYTTLIETSIDGLALLLNIEYSPTIKEVLKDKISGKAITGIKYFTRIIKELEFDAERERLLNQYGGNAEIIGNFYNIIGEKKKAEDMSACEYITL